MPIYLPKLLQGVFGKIRPRERERERERGRLVRKKKKMLFDFRLLC